MHMPGAQGLKSKHPAAKMCTQSVGCTLDSGHWTTFRLRDDVHTNGSISLWIYSRSNFLQGISFKTKLKSRQDSEISLINKYRITIY